MNNIKVLLLSALLGMGLVAAVAQPVGAINLFDDCAGNEICDEANDDTAASSLVQTLISTLLYIIGIICVIVIIVGGIKYTTSNGDSNQITSAKNTILYAVIGLVVAMLAFAIVNFVVAQF